MSRQTRETLHPPSPWNLPNLSRWKSCCCPGQKETWLKLARVAPVAVLVRGSMKSYESMSGSGEWRASANGTSRPRFKPRNSAVSSEENSPAIAHALPSAPCHRRPANFETRAASCCAQCCSAIW